jgi:hypothetical protein
MKIVAGLKYGINLLSMFVKCKCGVRLKKPSDVDTGTQQG